MDEADNVEVAEVTEAPVEARPEWLPEKFNTAEDLVSSYSNLESKLGKGEQELRESITKEMNDQMLADRPATVGEYVLPDSIDEAEASDNGLLDWWSNFCYDNGYGQDKFADGIEKYTNAITSHLPDLETEKTKLGDNADARIEAVQLWAGKFFEESQMSALQRLGESAEGIEAMEKIIDALKQTGIASNIESTTQMSEDDLRSMMNDDRYWKQGTRDPAYVKQVQDGFAKLYR
jgi:hypothetical protein